MKIKNLLVISVIFSLIFGFVGGILAIKYYPAIVGISSPSIVKNEITTSEEEAIINVVNKSLPSVVSILVKGKVSLPGFSFFSEEIEGGGSGFIVSSDGMILTNKHVVEYEDMKYTVIVQNGEEYEAKILAKDPVQDLAILKIEKTGLLSLSLGDSDKIQIGQTVIAIGNALGEFQNTVSTGVVSGLSRKIVAQGMGGTLEAIEELIQTDAAINQGNSGGPLLNLSGQVIGINTAMAYGAENIGFAIPVNKAKKAISDVKEKGKIVYPFLGVRYVLVNDAIQAQFNLPVNYGAWIRGSEEEPAIVPQSGAEKAGLLENDIILEMDGEKITQENTLAKMILKHEVGDQIQLKILRQGQEIYKKATLGEM